MALTIYLPEPNLSKEECERSLDIIKEVRAKLATMPVDSDRISVDRLAIVQRTLGHLEGSVADELDRQGDKWVETRYTLQGMVTTTS